MEKKRKKKNIDILVYIARACMSPEISDTLTAHVYLNYASELNKFNPPYFETLGDLYLMEGNLGLASVNYESSVYYDKNYSEGYYKLGLLYSNANSYQEAYDAFHKAIDANPDLILVYRSLGDLCFSHGVYKEAKDAYTTYLQRSEYDMDDQERYALILFFTKEFSKADSVLTELIRGRTDNPVMYRIEGYIAYETGDYAKGLKEMQRFFQMQRPDKILASDYEYYGNLLYKNGQDSLAIVNLEKSIKADSSKDYNFNTIAKIYSKNNNHDKAIEYYRLAPANTSQKILDMNFNIGLECFYAGSDLKARYDSLKKSGEKQKILNPATDPVQDRYKSYLKTADSCFANVTLLASKSYLGYIWRARTQSLLDPESQTDSAKNLYDKVLSMVQTGDQNKYQKEIVECYRYFGSYYFFKSDRENKTDPKESAANKDLSKSYFEKILEMAPDDQQAKTVLTALNQNKAKP